jgi:hypothetical protein
MTRHLCSHSDTTGFHTMRRPVEVDIDPEEDKEHMRENTAGCPEVAAAHKAPRLAAEGEVDGSLRNAVGTTFRVGALARDVLYEAQSDFNILA